MKTMNMIMPLILTGLAGCGGSGGGSITSTPGDTTTSTAIDYGNGVVLTPNGNGVATAAVQTFDDGSGVVRGEINGLAAASTSSSTKVVAITDDVAGWASGVSETDINMLVALGLPSQGNYGDVATYYAGDIQIGSKTYSVDVFEPANGTEGVIAVGWKSPDPSSGEQEVLAAIATGSSATNLPSGQHTYTGLHLVGSRNIVRENNGTGDVLTTGSGTFTMSVNFDDGTGHYSGVTGENSGIYGNETALQGNLVLDTNNGVFSGENLDLSGSINGTSLNGMTADLEGSFHGDGATSVTGVYVTEDITYGGAFLGSR